MSLNFGNKSIKDIYYGNKKIAKVYKGSKLIYSSTPTTAKYRVFLGISKSIYYIDSDDLTTFHKSDITDFGTFQEYNSLVISKIDNNSNTFLVYLVDQALSQATTSTYNIMYSIDKGLTWKKSILPDNFYTSDASTPTVYMTNDPKGEFFLISNLAVKGNGQTFETITRPSLSNYFYYDSFSNTLGVHPPLSNIETSTDKGITWVTGDKENISYGGINEIVSIPKSLSNNEQLYLLLSSNTGIGPTGKYIVVNSPFTVINNTSISIGNTFNRLQTTSIVGNQFAWASQDFNTLYYVNPDVWTEGMTLEFKKASLPSGVSTFFITSIGDRFLLIPASGSTPTTTLYTSSDLTSGNWQSSSLSSSVSIATFGNYVSSIKL